MATPAEVAEEKTRKQKMYRPKTERVQRYNNSDGMRESLMQPHEGSPKKAVKDPKDIVNARFDAQKFKASLPSHTLCHRKGDIAIRDGKVFYLK